MAITLDWLLWGNDGKNLVLPISTQIYKKITMPDKPVVVYKRLSFNEFPMTLNNINAGREMPCVASINFQDFSREMNGGNALLLKVKGTRGGALPANIITDEIEGDYWVMINVMSDVCKKKNRRDLLRAVTNATNQINTLKQNIINECTQAGTIIGLQALMHEVGVNDKEMARVVDAMHSNSYPLESKWLLVGQVIYNAEKAKKDTKGIGQKLKNNYTEKARQIYNRVSDGLEDILHELKEDRSQMERSRNIIPLQKPSILGILVGGVKTMERYHKGSYHEKFPTSYVVHNDTIGRKAFETFVNK